jgi:mannitol/fructose-specific phosphotransferase system IIA component (Ntr-type)
MVEKASQTYRVYELLKKSNIIMQLEKTPKKEIIKGLIHHLPENEVSDVLREEIFKAIKKRESIESTGIGNGVAIPHARLDEIKDFYILLGLSRDGIDFEAIDKKTVHIVFLVLSGGQDKVLYIRVLARLARLLHNNEFRSGLLKQKTPDDVINHIRKYESF